MRVQTRTKGAGLVAYIHQQIANIVARALDILQKVGPVDYEVHRPGHLCTRQIYHINLLRKWHQPEGWAAFTEDRSEDLGPQRGNADARLTGAIEQIHAGEELMAAQKEEV